MAVPFLALCMQKKSGVLNRTPLEDNAEKHRNYAI